MGSVQVALAHARRLLERDPALAAEQASEILKVAPNHPPALLLLAIAQRQGGNAQSSLELLNALVLAHPAWPALHYERGLGLAALQRGEQAVAALREAVRLDPVQPDAWRALADHLDAIGDTAAADEARAQFLKASTHDPRLLAAAVALCENQIPTAEGLLRQHLLQHPTDIAAIRMFAEVAARLNRWQDAEHLLARCLELAPAFHGARHNYAVALLRQGKHAAALPQVEALRSAEPGNPGYRSLQAAVLGGIGDYAGALALYEAVLREYPGQARVWMSYGHALKTAGRSSEGVAAYRRTLSLDPGLGEAWWSLANLKTYRFSDAELDQMRAELARDGLKPEDRLHLQFALGKTLEDRGQYAAAFAHYQQGNATRRAQVPYDESRLRELVARTRRLFTVEFVAQRSGGGCPAPDPIFIVGLPRAGSTLIEQILASHSQVEGTMELADLPALAHEVGSREGTRYPEALAELGPEQLRALGASYLARTQIQRKQGKPFFIDKLPNNFLHTGFIQLILPRAKIIDARRHPLGCCLSCFKQHFARGQNYTYDLGELGGYYAGYVELMAHFDAVLPGRVHRVFYEQLVQDTEAQVRSLLAYCGLPFESQCLHFYATDRAVRTASSEQVRLPIFREGMEQWRHFEPWLGPLRVALGPLLDAYPQVPEFPS